MPKTTDNPIRSLAAPSATSAVDSASERRRVIRYPFTAAADVIELQSDTRVAGRSSDLGLGGCFIDVLSPFPVGAVVRVHIKRDQQVFEAIARVAYSQQSLGMGLAFTQVKPEHQPILRRWIAELNGEPSLEPAIEKFEPEPEEVPPALRVQHVLNEFINLMVRKKVINEAEGTDLLRKLF